MNENELRFWETIIKAHTKRLSGRDVYVWGAYSKGKAIADILEKEDVSVAGYIDTYRSDSDYCGKKVHSLKYITGISPKPFIFIGVEMVLKEILEWLNDNSYKETYDYVYVSKLIPYFEISSFRGKYEDKYNNCFYYEGDDSLSGVKLKCAGGNNVICIGKNISGGELIIEAGYGSRINIGDNLSITGTVILIAPFGGIVNIGHNCSINDGSIIDVSYGGSVNLGEKNTIGHRFFASSGKNSPVNIGNDCMISYDVSIHGTNAHSIFDLEKKESLSLKNEKPIILENHIWIGKNATILYGTHIGEGAIIGACALAKGDYPGKTIIAGNIAKVIRNNCSWDRRKDIEYEQCRFK